MNLVAGIGHQALDVVAAGRAALVLLGRALRRLNALERPLAFEQAYVLGNRSLFFIVVIMMFTGAIMVVQAGVQARQIIGDVSTIGPAFLPLLVREFGPTIVALMVAARYGAGVAAELGAMTVSEQVDALRMTGAEPEAYLVAPRLVAGLVAMLPLVVLGSATAYATGFVAARYGFGVSWDTYFSLKLLAFGDVGVGATKSVLFGLAVPLVACAAGLASSGGAPGVGLATTRAVVGSSLVVLFLDLLVGALAQMVGA